MRAWFLVVASAAFALQVCWMNFVVHGDQDEQSDVTAGGLPDARLRTITLLKNIAYDPILYIIDNQTHSVSSTDLL